MYFVSKDDIERLDQIVSHATMQIVDEITSPDRQPIDILLVMPLPIRVSRTGALTDQAIDLEQDRKDSGGVEAFSIGSDLVHRVCGSKAPHTGVDCHERLDLDFVLSDRGDVLLSADEPLPPLKSDLRQLPESFLWKLLGDGELLGDKSRSEPLDVKALADVFQTAEAEACGLALHALLDHRLPGDKGLVDRFVAPGRDELLFPLCAFHSHKVPDDLAQLRLSKNLVIIRDEALVRLPKAGDREIVGAPLLADKTKKKLLILRIGPDLSGAFDQRACRAANCRRK